MTILADHEIAALCRVHSMIDPFVPEQARHGSYGLSSYGYDLRLGKRFKLLRCDADHILDPDEDNSAAFGDYTANEYILEPSEFILAVTLERLCIPRDVSAIVLGKSSYARLGLSQICTPLEAGWTGYVTLELVNHAALPLRLRAGRGIVQVVFYRGAPPLVSYADRGGIFMDQPGEPVIGRHR